MIYMLRYVTRGFEDRIINALEKYGLAIITGLPGTGKTTSTRYIALKLRERGYIPVILRSTSSIEKIDFKEVDFPDEEGDKHRLYEIMLGSTISESIDDDLATSMIWIINQILLEASKGGSPLSIFKNLIRKISNYGVKLVVDKDLYDKIDRISSIANLVSIVLGRILDEIIDLRKTLKTIIEIPTKLAISNEFQKVVIIVDDLAEFSTGIGGEKSESNLRKFINKFRRKNIRLLLVRRLVLESEYLEYIDKLDNTLRLRYINKLFTGREDAHFLDSPEQVEVLLSLDFKEFREILEANNISGDYEKLYKYSGGFPWLAILYNMLGIDLNKLGRELSGTGVKYYSQTELEKITDREERGRKGKTTIEIVLAGARQIYEKLVKENYSLLPVLIQPLAKDELRMLRNDPEIKKLIEEKAYRFAVDLDDYVEKKLLIKEYEEWKNERREVYDVSELLRHLRLLLTPLSNKYATINRENIFIRRKLLETITDELMKEGEYTSRMVLYTLENVEWLENNVSIGIRDRIDLLKRTFIWNTAALIRFTTLGLRYKSLVLEIWEEVINKTNKLDNEIKLYATLYAFRLLNTTRVSTGAREELYRAIDEAKIFIAPETDNQIIHTHRIDVYLEIAKIYSVLGDKDNTEKYILEAKKLLEKIGDPWLKKIAEIHYSLGYVEALMTFIEPCRLIEVIESILNELVSFEKEIREEIPQSIKSYVKPYGGRPDEKIQGQLKHWFYIAYTWLGILYLQEGSLEEARKYLIKALNHTIVKTTEVYLLMWLGKLSVIKDYSFKWCIDNDDCRSFEDLVDMIKEDPTIPLEYRLRIYAEYTVSRAIMDGAVDSEKLDFVKKQKEYPDVSGLLMGLLAIHGCKDVKKEEVLRFLLDLELHILATRGKALMNMYDIEPYHIILLKRFVEDLYNYVLEENWKRYELVKKIDVKKDIFLDVRIWNTTVGSDHALTRLMFYYLVGDIDTAARLAEQKSRSYKSKLNNRLFGELARALKKRDEEEIRRCFTKLFYYHV